MTNRFLVVDDTPANIQALAGTPKEKGCQIRVATHGRQALEVVARARPGLILLEVVMPEMDKLKGRLCNGLLLDRKQI